MHTTEISDSSPTGLTAFHLEPLRCALIAAIVICTALPAMAQYRIATGDVIEISVAGIPSLRREVAIDPDGAISYPLIGTAQVAGLTLAQARAKLKAALGSKIFRQKTPTGLDNAILIQSNHITVTVAKYRPIYVGGSVTRPGEYSFRPDMTVRQAITLAGGYNRLGARAGNPLLVLSDLRSEHEALWVEFTREKARIWRINSELGTKGTDSSKIMRSIPLDAPISRATVSQLVGFASRLLKERQDQYARQQDFIRASSKTLKKQIDIVSVQEKKETQGAAADLVELKRLLKFYKKGTLVQSRLAEVRRAILLSATRKLQTSALLIDMKKKKDGLSRKLVQLAEDRRLKLLTELEIATLRLNQLQSKLRSTSEKIHYLQNPNLKQPGATGASTRIVVYRKDQKDRKELVADESFELEPGDVINIKTRLARSATKPAKRGKPAKRTN